jgi:dephospho-CoA kinase
VHIRVDGWPNQQFALLFVDWLTANPDARADYMNVKRSAEKGGGGDTAAYVEVKEPWFRTAYRQAWKWADSTGWKP